jgi:replicative DNA helicase
MNIEHHLTSVIINNPHLKELIKPYQNIFRDKMAKRVIKFFMGQEVFNFNAMVSAFQKEYSPDALFGLKLLDCYESNYHIYFERVYTDFIRGQISDYTVQLLGDTEKKSIDIRDDLKNILDGILLEDHFIDDSKEACMKLLNNFKLEKVLSGISDLDNIQGGYNKTDFVIVGARPSVGKTSYAGNLILRNLKDNKRVGIITSEVNTDQFMQMLACNVASVDSTRINTINFTKEDEIKLVKALEVLYEKTLFLSDRCRYIEDVVKTIKTMQRKHNIDLVYIDYLQYLQTRNKKLNTLDKLEMISGELKSLSKEIKIPIICLAQLNREGEKSDKPKMSDLKGCGAIEQDADIIILIQNSNLAIDGDFNKRLVNFYIAKNRFGPLIDYKQIFYTQYRRFVDAKY